MFKKKVFIIILIVILFSFSLVGSEPEELKTIKTPYTTTTINGEKYSLTIYKFAKNVCEDGEWISDTFCSGNVVDYKQARSLKDKEGWRINYLENDNIHDFDVLDFGIDDNGRWIEAIPYIKDSEKIGNVKLKKDGKFYKNVNINSLNKDNNLKEKFYFNSNLSIGETSTILEIRSDDPSEPDSAIYQASPDENLGSGTTMETGSIAGSEAKFLIGFEFKANGLPSDIEVVDSHINITIAGGDPEIQDWTYNISRVLRDWGEGTSNNPALEGEVTWNSAKHDQVAWTVGGCGDPDTDCEPLYEGERVYPLTTSGELKINGTEFDNFVEDIANNIQPDYGVMVQALWDAGKYNYFFTREYAEESKRPVAHIEYISDPKPIVIVNQTLPLTPLVNTDTIINTQLNDTDYDEINYTKFSLIPPNGTVIFDQANGTYSAITPPYYLNWSSQVFKPDVAGEWTWNYSATDNSTEANTRWVVGKFTITDLTSPVIVNVTEPVNNTYSIDSSLDIEVVITDNLRIDSWWFEIINITGELLQENLTVENCNDVVCKVNKSQYSFPIETMWLYIYANDSSGNMAVEEINLSIGTDTSAPEISLTQPTGTKTSKEVTANFSITDNGVLETCIYDVFVTSTQTSVFSDPNRTISSCSTNTSLTFNTAVEGIFTFKMYANDSEGNNATNSSDFTVSLSVPTPPGGDQPGGGGKAEEDELRCDAKDIQWVIKPRSFNTLLGKNSHRNRKIEIINNGTKQVIFDINCDDTSNVNFTKNSCDFVNISTTELIVEPNIEQPEYINVRINTPEQAEFGDRFSFGIFFTDNEACSGTVSFVNTISVAGSFFKIFQSKLIGKAKIPIFIPFFLVMGVIVLGGYLGKKLFFLFLPLSILVALIVGFVILVFI